MSSFLESVKTELDGMPPGEPSVTRLRNDVEQVLQDLEREQVFVREGHGDWLLVRGALVALAAIAIRAAQELKIETAEAAIDKTIPF